MAVRLFIALSKCDISPPLVSFAKKEGKKSQLVKLKVVSPKKSTLYCSVEVLEKGEKRG